jgi:hypothetical protein
VELDLVTFAQNALAPAKINRVAVREEPIRITVRDEDGDPVLDDERRGVTEEGKETVLDVIVGTEQLSLAIGKRGQNVRLASKLLDCRIEIKSEEAVKDELASALASMLREMEGIAEEDEMPGGRGRHRGVDYDSADPPRGDGNAHRSPARALESHGIHTAQDVLSRTPTSCRRSRASAR